MGDIAIRFEPTGRTVKIDPAAAPFAAVGRAGSLLDVAVAHGIEIAANCGGHGICGACYVLIEWGAESLCPSDAEERQVLETMTDNAPSGRLACQAVPSGDVTVRVPN